MLRTKTCGQLRKEDIGQEVTLTGWVHNRRDHGGIIFVDLRDHYGLTQINFDPEKNKKAWEQADKLRNEWVIKATGTVVARPDDMINDKLATGEIEVEIFDLEIFSQAETPPFSLDENKAKEANESLRLKYRFLDLRRPKFQEIMKKRDEVITFVRDFLHKQDFVEVQTPILANSSPEGARDYLVPSRLHPGKFYALPQAPQQFKQLLMVGGLDRYFQIAPCFRDEDPRADRHPGDFYQIDMEMSFVETEDIWQIKEELIKALSQKFSKKSLVFEDFPRISYKEAMEKYGTDKPDLRFDLAMIEITDLVKNCGFAVFKGAVNQGGTVKALRIPNGSKFTRKEIDELTELAKENGAKGLAYIIVKDKELQSPIVKFLGEDLAKKIVAETKSEVGDIIFFGADNRLIANRSLGAVRSACGQKLDLTDKDKLAWAWIVDFPMYEFNEDESKIDFSHNPFSMPQGGQEALKTEDPLEIKAYQYDLVCNGYEVASGAIRNHDPEIMYEAFALAGYSREQVEEKFGHMLKAFSYGAPPHGGIASGLDRILMILFDCQSIRDIYAFPKDGQAKDAMLNSPSSVDEKQLKELGLKIVKD